MRLFASATGLLAILSVLNTSVGAAPTKSGFEISWEEAYAKAEKLVSGWTLEQKVNVGTGTKHLRYNHMMLLLHNSIEKIN